MKNKKQSGFTLLEALVIIILFSIIGCICWYVYNHNTASNEKTNSTNDLSALVDEIGQSVAGKYPEYSNYNRGWEAESADGKTISVPGYDFYITTDSQPTVVIQSNNTINLVDIRPEDRPVQKTTNGTVANATKDHLVTNGFKLKDSKFASEDYKPSVFTYTKNDETCTVTSEAYYYRVILTCTSPALEEATALHAKPFVAEFLVNNADVTAKDIIFGPLQIKSKSSEGSPISASQTGGYDIAEALLRFGDKSHTIALFYRYANEPWKFVTSAGDEFGFKCSTYEVNTEIRKAMYGQVCYGNEGQIHFDKGTTIYQ